MSEFMNICDNRTGFHRRLLATVSAIALLGFAFEADQARAADSDRPPFWIELGGQLAEQENSQEVFLPPFVLTTPRPPFETVSPIGLEKGPPSSWDGMAKIAFEPAGTDWIFSAGIRYGKSARHQTRDQQTAHASHSKYGAYDAYQNFAAQRSESHAVLDFQVGKDVGLGMFASGGSSVIGLGLRYAQFNSQSSAGVKSQPTNVDAGNKPYYRFYASFAAKRKFTGVGPLLSWDASANLIGNPSAGGITFDWGLNGAVLFGRQRTRVHHQTTKVQVVFHTGTYHNGHDVPHIPIYHHATSPSRSKQVAVPNLGGFAGVSWRLLNAKVSVGYRADMFFGAMDGGIDTRKSENRGFYGPFASISVGLP